jgi:hypothetical protein
VFDLTYFQGLLFRHGCSRIFSLSDLSCIEIKTDTKAWPLAITGIGSRYFMISTYPHFKMYDLSTLTEKYILEKPYVGDEFITGNDAFFAIARYKSLIIFRPEDGSKIDEMNIFDLIDDEAERIRVQGADWIFRGMEMAKNTLVIRVMVIDDEAVSWLFFYISGLDKCIRKCITLDSGYCNKYGSVDCMSVMFVTSVDTVIEASFFYTDQQCHEYATYDTISFDLETFEHQVVEKTFTLEWALHYVGITPDLLCTFKSREPPSNDTFDCENCGSIDAINIYSNIAGELRLVTCISGSPFNAMGRVRRIFADENWVFLWSEMSLDIWGFDELKCEALRPLVRGN